MSDTLRGSIYGILAASTWGGVYVVSDVVLATIPPFTLLNIRLFLGLIVLLALLRTRKGLVYPQGLDRWKMLLVGVVGFGLSLGAQFVGTDLSTAVNGALITTASPAFILLFAPLILKEKVNLLVVASVALAILGVIIIIDPRNADFGSSTFAGDMVLTVAALTWGLYSVLVRWVSKNYDTLIITSIAFVGGMLVTLPIATWELSQKPIGEINLLIILGVLYLGVISTAGAMWWWNRAFALVDASSASLFFFAQPLVGSILSVWLLGQEFTVNLAIGSVLIVAGVLLSMLRKAPPEQN